MTFEMWCWRRLLRVPWTGKDIQLVNPKRNQSLVFIGRLMLKLQYFGHLMQRNDSLEKTLMLEKIEGGRRRGRQRMRWLDGIADSYLLTWVWASSGSWWRTGNSGVLPSMQLQSQTHLSDWTELNWCLIHMTCHLSSHSVGGSTVKGCCRAVGT